MSKVYSYPVEPEKYPEYTTRYAKAVTRADLDNRIHFTSLRGFSSTSPDMAKIGQAADAGERPIQDDGSRLTDPEEDIACCVDHFRMGDVLWPVYMTLFASNFGELVELCRRRGLYLFDFWGYVPGSRTVKDMWGEYSIPEKTDRQMQEILGDRFLGYDNGEQDGRYTHAFASTAHPQKNDRKYQYRNFQAYFEKLNDAMQNHTVTLASLTFLPYFAREGNTILLGAETAQALPSNPMWFSFIRGASKQYGLLNYGNASIWNRWGWKHYGWLDDEPDTSTGNEGGRTAGTSLSLLRRLIYNQYLYGCDILGFEGGWFGSRPAEEGEVSGEEVYVKDGRATFLTPIGDIQHKCVRFTEEHGSPGVHYAPVCVIADAFAGWVPPRHLYSGDIYKVWGNLPYGDGDYQLHGIFDLLFPGYEDSGFYRDERGFLTPTPYGEILDVLLSDVRGEILARYDTAILLSGVTVDRELSDKLKAFVFGGGHLLVFGPSPLPEEFPNITVIPGNGLRATGDTACRNVPNEPIPHPFVLSEEAREALDAAFSRVQLLRVNNPALQYTLALRDEGHYTLYVANNTYADERFDLIPPDGSVIESVEEWVIRDTAAEHEEFLPRRKYCEPTAPTGIPGVYELRSHDCRIFSVTVKGAQAEYLPESNPAPGNRQLYLSMGYTESSAKDFLLYRPTFLHHFGGLMIPATYFDRLSEAACEKEGHYFRQQKVSVLVDFTGMLNHVPDLTIIGNFPHRTEQSVERMQEIVRKAAYYGCAGAIFSFHRNAENEWSVQDALDSSVSVLKRMKAFCVERGIPAYFTNRPASVANLKEQLTLTEAEDFPSLAFQPAFVLLDWKDEELPEHAKLLLLSDLYTDAMEQRYPFRTPLSRSTGWRKEYLRRTYEAAAERELPVVLSADYEDWDGVIADLAWLRGEDA